MQNSSLIAHLHRCLIAPTRNMLVLVHYHYYPVMPSIIRKPSAQSRTQHAKRVFILSQCRKKANTNNYKKAIHKMHVNPGAYLSKRKLFLISILMGRYATLLLYANNDFTYWICLEKEHLYGFHSNLGTSLNEKFNSFAPVGQCSLLKIASMIMHRSWRFSWKPVGGNPVCLT